MPNEPQSRSATDVSSETTGDDEFESRLQRLRTAMERSGLDALIAYSNAALQANVRYLSGYWALLAGAQGLIDGGEHTFGSCICLVPLDGEPVLLIDQQWDLDRARGVSRIGDVRYTPIPGHDLGTSIRQSRFRRVGIDNWDVFPAREYLAMSVAAAGATFEPSRILRDVRRVKGDSEIALIRKAAALADTAMRSALDAVKPGANEYELVLRCEDVMRAGGDIQLGAGTIGGCGSNSSTGSSMPMRDTGRTLLSGEWMFLDICPRVRGYCGDMARVRVAGDVADLDPSSRRIAAAAALMNEEVRKAVRPGTSGRQLNRLADDVAREEGVLDFKVDLLGHGIGLDVVDTPSFYFDETPLSAGEVITIEPCLLIPGMAGVRIEDMVLVTNDGAETLTTVDRGLLTV